MSVPPVSSWRPPSISVAASALALATMRCWYSRNDSVAASLKHTALAAMMWHSGPPWRPGNTALSTAAACSARHSTSPARGPASVLWVVEVTTSACSTGLGCMPAATRPEKCAMSTISRASDLVGDLPGSGRRR